MTALAANLGCELDVTDFFCADPMTEILTAKGWRTHDQVKVGDVVASLDTNTGRASWVPVQRMNVFDVVDEKMLHVSGKGLSALVTTGHRWPVRQRVSTPTGRAFEWQVRTSDQLTVDSSVQRSAPFDLPIKKTVSDDFVEMVGWSWTEGNIRDHGGIHVTQSVTANPENCDRIDATMQRLFGPPKARAERIAGEPAWGVSTHVDQRCWRLNAAAASAVLLAAPDFVLDPAWILTLTSDQIDLLVEVSVLADGTTRLRDGHSETTLSQSRIDRAEAFQFAAILSGRTTSIHQWWMEYEGDPYSMWRVSLLTKTTAKPLRQAVAEWTTHTGIVWCPTVEHGTWLCRRDGLVHWTGNCGAGGASTGLAAAGFRIVTAANHWDRAIETHAANHPGTEHICADINNFDMRRIPRTRVLWASVICTEISPAGGRKRTHGQTEILELGAVRSEGFERTRATALDVIRATEVHRYDVVVVENVMEFATDWELFDWWRNGMQILGYRSQVTSVSSAHIGGDGNEAAPQWRDRIYVVFARQGVPMPDTTPRPLAWCPDCQTDVNARQAWRNGRTIGKYKQQYDYRCENDFCRHRIVEPYIVPASAALDLSNLGTRIGDRVKPLAAATMRKIERGLIDLADLPEPILITTTHGGSDPRAMPVLRAPMPTRSTKIGEGLVTPPGAFIAELRGGGSKCRPITHPLATVTASGNHHALVIPYRKGSTAKPVSEPLHTLSTKEPGGLVGTATAVEDCSFRMIGWQEQMRGQRFAPDYVMAGNVAEKTMLAGNAVSVNVAQWIGGRVAAALDGRAT